MSERMRRRFVRRFILGVWAVITLILIFCVALLMNEMSRQGMELPTFDFGTTSNGATNTVRPTTSSIREVSLFFANADGARLARETADLTLSSSTANNCRLLVERLIEGPRTLEHLPIVPPATVVRGVYLIGDGELVIDLSREAGQDLPEGALTEGLFFYGIVGTVTQPFAAGDEGPVRSVRFLFEGAPPQDRFPKHIDASAPLMPHDSWFRETDTTGGANG